MLNSLKQRPAALPSYYLAKAELENVRLTVFEILEKFFNPLTADDKYSSRNRKNLPQQIQLQLSKNQNIFS